MRELKYLPPMLAAGLSALAAFGLGPEPPADASPDGAGGADGRLTVAVLPLGLTAATAERYPQLAERYVGFGVHNMLVERLYDTGRFRMVEDKPEVIEDLVNRQWMAASGGVSQDSAVRHGQLLGARYVVYGEVFEFASQKVRKKLSETRVALQIRLVDVETSEYVPASGAGAVSRKGRLTPADRLDFARSTIGQATRAALEKAVPTLIGRLPG